jgi:hypothetical protein
VTGKCPVIVLIVESVLIDIRNKENIHTSKMYSHIGPRGRLCNFTIKQIIIGNIFPTETHIGRSKRRTSDSD